MNKRIEQLAQECTEYITGTLDGDFEKFDYKKFAELLIEECILIARKAENEDEVYAWFAISNHFGVEE